MHRLQEWGGYAGTAYNSSWVTAQVQCTVRVPVRTKGFTGEDAGEIYKDVQHIVAITKDWINWCCLPGTEAACEYSLRDVHGGLRFFLFGLSIFLSEESKIRCRHFRNK